LSEEDDFSYIKNSEKQPFGSNGPLMRVRNPKEVEVMSDTKITLGNQAGTGKETPASKWRNTLAIAGMFCIMAGVFVGAASKEAGGVAAKFLAIAGALLIAISIVTAAINAVSSRLNRGKGTSVESRS
jgi:hypothetical protein